MAQVQCPNCGGYRVSTETETLNLKTGRKVNYGCALWAMVLLGGGLCLFGFMAIADGSGITGAILILSGIITALLIFRGLAKQSKAGDTITVYHHACDLCGYKWTWRENEAMPQVQVRPDLIVAGEQRLREAEERRRRDAEAYQAWQNQQGE